MESFFPFTVGNLMGTNALFHMLLRVERDLEMMPEK